MVIKENYLEAQYLAAIVDSADDAIISKNLDGIITSWNRGAEKIFGYSKEEAIGRHVSMLIPPDRLNEEPAILEQIRQGKKIDHYETVRVRKDGRRINISLTISPVRNENGEVIGASKIARDITEVKEAVVRNAMLAAIVDSSDDAIIGKDLDRIITSWNGGAEKIFGYSKEEAIGKSVSILIPPERLNEEPVILEQVRQGQKIDHYETVRMRKDGRRVNISLTVSPIKNDKGEIVGASKIARDITDAEEADIKNAMLAAIVRSSNDAIISKNLDGIIQSWNYGAEKIFGYNESEVIGKFIGILIPQDRLAEEETILSKIRNGERVPPFETVRLTKEGKPIDISLTVSPIINKEGRVVGASKIARDITLLKELERKKDEFISIASHELKTPLTSLKAYIQLMMQMKEGRDTRMHQYVSKAYGFALKLEELVNDLLDVTKIQAGKIRMDFETFDFDEVLSEAIETISHQAPRHSIIKQSVEGAKVYADKRRIEQVLFNYLSNAVKYSPESDKVMINVTKEAGQLKVAVTDFGIGIPKEKQLRIFDRFYRAVEQNPKFQGLGIGLYISSEIINRHNGKTWVESEEGKGSTFYFTLPLKGPDH